MRCEEMPELITALVDNELSSEEGAEARTHMTACPDCRALYERERTLKTQIRSAGRAVAAPASLRQNVERMFANRSHLSASRPSWQGWLTVRAFRPAIAALLILLAFSPLVYRWWPVDNLGLAALATHAEILAGRAMTERTSDPQELRSHLTRAVDGRFAPVALDLSMRRLFPVAGLVQKIDGRDVLVTIYQGDGPTVTCFTFLGSESDAPASAEVSFDPAMRVNFYSFSSGEINGLLHQQGQVICLLVSKLPPVELLAIVRGLAGHA